MLRAAEYSKRQMRDRAGWTRELTFILRDDVLLGETGACEEVLGWDVRPDGVWRRLVCLWHQEL